MKSPMRFAMILSAAMAATAGAQAGKTTPGAASAAGHYSVPYERGSIWTATGDRTSRRTSEMPFLPANGSSFSMSASFFEWVRPGLYPVIGAFCQISGQRFSA